MTRWKMALLGLLMVPFMLLGIIAGNSLYGGLPNHYCSWENCTTLQSTAPECAELVWCRSMQLNAFYKCVPGGTLSCTDNKDKYGSTECVGTCDQAGPPVTCRIVWPHCQ